jgi:Fe-S-cluster containining protein
MQVGAPPGSYDRFALTRPEAWGGPDHFTRDPDYATWLGMPEELRRELTAYYRAALRDRTIPDRSARALPCLWFDAEVRRCRHYDHRPRICRGFEVGGEPCRNYRLHRGIDAARPPGGPPRLP